MRDLSIAGPKSRILPVAGSFYYRTQLFRVHSRRQVNEPLIQRFTLPQVFRAEIVILNPKAAGFSGLRQAGYCCHYVLRLIQAASVMGRNSRQKRAKLFSKGPSAEQSSTLFWHGGAYLT